MRLFPLFSWRLATIIGVTVFVAALAVSAVASADTGDGQVPSAAPGSIVGPMAWIPEGGPRILKGSGQLDPGTSTAQPQPSPFSGKRVGLQAGHWQTANAPAELASLRSSTGASAAGYREVDLNLKIARLVAGILESKGIEVDVLPTTLPVKYQADAFVAIHADAAGSAARGYKIARSGRSAIPAQDDALVSSLYSAYGKATGLPTNGDFTDAMRYYYAFTSSRLQHTVAAITPAAIVEMGYLTNALDRSLMVNSSDRVAQGIAQGILDFLSHK